MRVIRKILDEKPDEFWTGTKFDPDINRAKEIKSSRHAAAEKRKALEFANRNKSVAQKTDKVVFTEGFEDSTEDAAFIAKYQSKRHGLTKAETYDSSLTSADGNLDAEKVKASMAQKHADKRLEAIQLSNKSSTPNRVASPQKKDSPE